MAELPGWDRRRLRTAEPADVEAARWIAYARTYAEFLDVDFDGKITELERADEKVSKVQLRARRRSAIAELKKAKGLQRKIRDVLELDLDDDAPARRPH